MNEPTIFIFSEEAEFWNTALEDVVLSIKETLKHFDECRVGLAGGNTPKPLYEKLSSESLPWEKIKFIQLDERQVPSDHPQSNLRMLRQSLFNKIPIPPGNILTFDTSLPPQSAAKEMSRKLLELTHRRFPLFDLLILGAGADGHIASLFEEDATVNFHDYASPALAPTAEVKERLTLTLLPMRSTRQALLLLKGQDKQVILDALQNKSKLPPMTALHELLERVPIKVLAHLA